MNPAFVSYRHYQGLDDGAASGQASAEEMVALQKALVAGQDINNPGTSAGSGFALRPEDLSSSLKNTTYKLTDVQLWRALTKLPAFNTVVEYNRLEQYGSGVGAFIAEGDLPESDDSTYSRNYSVVKYLGTTRSVSHQMSLVRTGGGVQNVIGQETINGTAWLLRQAERVLFAGDSTLIPQQFDGLRKQITDGAPNATLNTIDLRGLPLTQDVINDAMYVVKSEPNYGQGTDLYCADGAFADLAKQFYPAQRLPITPQGWNNGMVGLNIQGMYTQFGPVRFHPDVFIQFGPGANTSAQGNAAKIPSTPSESVAPAAGALGGGETSQFIASDAGDYYWKVTAINRYGRSAPVTMTGAVTVAAGQKVTMTVADGATVGTAFEVFRSDKDGAATTCKLMTVVARSGATTAITDFNNDIPGTSDAFCIQQNLDFFAGHQLAPFTRIPLATIDTSIRWMQLLYFTLTVFAPGKGVNFKNVGRASGSAGLNNAELTSLLTPS